MVQHRPFLDQDVAPNCIKEPGGNWSKRPSGGLQQLAVAGIHEKEWSLCACDKNITNYP